VRSDCGSTSVTRRSAEPNSYQKAYKGCQRLAYPNSSLEMGSPRAVIGSSSPVPYRFRHTSATANPTDLPLTWSRYFEVRKRRHTYLGATTTFLALGSLGLSYLLLFHPFVGFQHSRAETVSNKTRLHITPEPVAIDNSQPADPIK
jgi:hypothetical protein